MSGVGDWDPDSLRRQYDIPPPPLDYLTHPSLLLEAQAVRPPTQQGLLNVLSLGIYYARCGIHFVGLLVECLIKRWREQPDFDWDPQHQREWWLLCSELEWVLNIEYDGELISFLSREFVHRPHPYHIRPEVTSSEVSSLLTSLILEESDGEFSSVEEDSFELAPYIDCGARADRGRLGPDPH